MRFLMLTLALLSLPALAMDPAPHDGSVKLEVFISPEGTVTDAKVLKSDMPPEFDQKAIDITKKFKYKPRKKNGKAVPAKGIQLIKFKKGDQ